MTIILIKKIKIDSTNERLKSKQTEDANNSFTSFGSIIGMATCSTV